LKVESKRFTELMNEQRQKTKSHWKRSGDSAKEGDF